MQYVCLSLHVAITDISSCPSVAFCGIRSDVGRGLSCPSRGLRSIEARRGSGDGLRRSDRVRPGPTGSDTVAVAEPLATRSPGLPAAGAPECSAAIPTASRYSKY